MMVSVPAPPPMEASPPPCPACSNTATARISESRIRMPTRIPYMRGARYLGYGGAHKLRPASGVERRAADQHAIELTRDDRRRVAGLALLQGFPNAEDRLEIGGEGRGHFLARLLVGLAKNMAPFGVADERQAGARLLGERSRDRAGERALGFPVNVLRSGQHVAMARDALRDCLERNGRREEPHRSLERDLTGRKEGAQVLAGLDRAYVHFPVAREDERSHASSSAATPGSSFPSRNSSDAPPPVETCVSLSSIPATAATESPPPTTVTAPFFPASTRAFAIARVPASNGGVSNTPIGPFQKIVLARSNRARKSCCVASSISKTAQPFGMASTATARFSLARSSDGAITAPRGRISFLPLVASSSLASAMRSTSTSESPTSSPMALTNVHAIAPPISSSSTRGNRDRITSILPEILAPPSTATKGCLGLVRSSPRYWSSFSIRKPATAGLRRCATAAVDECARCAEPNASLTYRSPSAANVLASSASFFS